MNSSSRHASPSGLIAIAIFGALIAGFNPVAAAEPGAAHITVKYADLDIASPTGALVLYQRIRAAAKSACNYFWFKRDADEAACVQHTMANAVSRVNQPALSAIYDTKNPISAPGALMSQSH